MLNLFLLFLSLHKHFIFPSYSINFPKHLRSHYNNCLAISFSIVFFMFCESFCRGRKVKFHLEFFFLFLSSSLFLHWQRFNKTYCLRKNLLLLLSDIISGAFLSLLPHSSRPHFFLSLSLFFLKMQFTIIKFYVRIHCK